MTRAETMVGLILVLIIGVTIAGIWYASTREDTELLDYFLSYWVGGLLGMFFLSEYRKANPRLPETVWQCPECLSTQEDEPGFCTDCGTELDSSHEIKTARADMAGQLIFCGHCGAEVGLEPQRCPVCDRAVLKG